MNFRLSERIPEGNFYKRLGESIDMEYLRKLTKCYYGSEGHKSIDPVVFFKLMLVGYLENICSYSSLTDPDARASQKKGKPLALNHLGIISVDARSHVIFTTSMVAEELNNTSYCVGAEYDRNNKTLKV